MSMSEHRVTEVILLNEALHSASPELHLTLYEFESASDCEWAMSNIAPHIILPLCPELTMSVHFPFSPQSAARFEQGLPEDDRYRIQDEIQSATDQYGKTIDEVLKKKTNDIMQN